MKKVLLTVFVIMIAATIAVSAVACSSGTGIWKLCKIDSENISKIELVNSGGAIKVLEGERLTSFMDEMGKLSVYKDDGAYPDNSYDYCLRIYLKGSDGYIRYYLGKEMVNVDMKSGAKEGLSRRKVFLRSIDPVSRMRREIILCNPRL